MSEAAAITTSEITDARVYHDALRETRLAVRFADGTEIDKPLREVLAYLVPQHDRADDPGTVKILTQLVDRAYKMLEMAGVLRTAEQDPNSNDPIVAWASDVRSILYRNGPPPDVGRDLRRVK